MIECGPVAGLIGSRYLGERLDHDDIIAVDMGGTTSKVGVIQGGALEYAREPMVNRYHYLAPKIEVVSIGAGGGSIIRLEPDSLAPLVGPDSAGARPGPVAYGTGGTEPTLTDVMLLVGYMHPDHFLGGTIELDYERCREIFSVKVAQPLGMSVEEAASGIYRVACSQMTDLIHEITVERGLDPRDYVLHAFGGTSPMLAGVFARELAVDRVVIPYTASVNCAFGLVASDVAHEFAISRNVPMPGPASTLNDIFDPMLEEGRRALRSEGFSEGQMRFDRAVALRYSRQVHELVTPIRKTGPIDAEDVIRIADDFERIYEQRYGKGSAYREAGVELTGFRLTARGMMQRPQLVEAKLGAADPGRAQIGKRRIFVEGPGSFQEAAIYDFTRLEPGNVIHGPSVIHTPVTTIVLQDHQLGRIDAYRNTVIEFS